jgi:hypothetical protein
MVSTTHHPFPSQRPKDRAGANPFALTHQLIQIHGKGANINTYTPDLGGGFQLAWQGKTVEALGSNPVWLAGTVFQTGESGLVQPYTTSGGGLGMVVYKQSGAEFESYWQSETMGPSPAGTWAVASASSTDDVDKFVRFQSAGQTTRFDLFAWSWPAKAMVRIGGTPPDSQPTQPVVSWMVLPGGKFPHIVTLQMAGPDNYALMRYEADASGTYWVRPPFHIPPAAGVRGLRCGRTARNGSVNVILYDTLESSVAVFAENGSMYREVSRAQVRMPAGDTVLPTLVGDFTGDQVADVIALRANSSSLKIAAASYVPVVETYVDKIATSDLGIPYRPGSAWLPIDSNRNGQMAAVNCFTVGSQAGISLLMPGGTGALRPEWTGANLAYTPDTVAWLAGRLA